MLKKNTQQKHCLWKRQRQDTERFTDNSDIMRRLEQSLESELEDDEAARIQNQLSEYLKMGEQKNVTKAKDAEIESPTPLETPPTQSSSVFLTTPTITVTPERTSGTSSAQTSEPRRFRSLEEI
ncbi:hypothetical protein AgCh_033243 [Apium graveolens]